MPRFFFHVFDDIVSMDEQGQSVDNLEAAHAIALDSARELVCEQVKRGYLNLENYIVIADPSGQELARVDFRSALAVERIARPKGA